MKISAEIREGNKITTFSADLEETEKAIKSAADKIEGFIKKTFKVECFEKKESQAK